MCVGLCDVCVKADVFRSLYVQNKQYDKYLGISAVHAAAACRQTQLLIIWFHSVHTQVREIACQCLSTHMHTHTPQRKARNVIYQTWPVLTLLWL